MADITTSIVEESVRDCLAHLYDYTFLQDHPLVRLLVPHIQGNASRVQAFQQLVLSAIERLKPHDSGNRQSKEYRLYSILSLRYQQQQQVQYVLRHLNLGERQFYRDYGKAVQALTCVLEEQLKEENTVAAGSLSLHTEIERAQRHSTPSLVDAEAFLQRTLIAIRGLAERQQVEITIQPVDTTLPRSIDQTLFRQVIIWIASQILNRSSAGTQFTIEFDVQESVAQIVFRYDSAESPRLFAERQETFELLLKALDAHLYEPDAGNIVLEIPFQPHSILIIDDNPDAITLYRQLLNGQPYQIFTAYDGTQAINLARETNPAFIILDILLPNQDGWEILQHLKNHPATIGIPVVICSVLDAADLATLLGADSFLLKPPQEDEFFDILRRLGK